MTAQNSPKEGSNGEDAVKQRVGDNYASQVVWKMPACPVQKKKKTGAVMVSSQKRRENGANVRMLSRVYQLAAASSPAPSS
jgi:hypothetical protein